MTARSYVELMVRCSADHNHVLGYAALPLEPLPNAGQILLRGGLRWEPAATDAEPWHMLGDGRGKVTADCAKCATGAPRSGRGQQLGRRRLDDALRHLVESGQHAGDLRI